MTTYVLVVGTFLTLVRRVMQATVPAVHQALGAFVYLIIVNCMILGRDEGFASQQLMTSWASPVSSTADMDILVAVIAFAFLFGLFAVSRVAERTRPCGGRSADGEKRCRTCPLQKDGSERFGPCPGSDGSPSQAALGKGPERP